MYHNVNANAGRVGFTRQLPVDPLANSRIMNNATSFF
jgi:hypothetical protein